MSRPESEYRTFSQLLRRRRRQRRTAAATDIFLGEFHSSWRKITRSFFFFYFLFRKAFSSKGKLIERGNWAKKQATWVLYSRRRAILDAIVSRATSIVQRDGSALCYIDGILSILSHRLSAGRVAWWKKIHWPECRRVIDIFRGQSGDGNQPSILVSIVDWVTNENTHAHNRQKVGVQKRFSQTLFFLANTRTRKKVLE